MTTTEDIISEPDETFILNYSADYAETADNATAKGTIENDDAQIITINSTSIPEAGGRAELEVTISPASTSPVNIEFSTSTDSASSSDYRLVTQSPLRFSANENKKSIFIDITNDTLNEADETITVTLTNTRGISPYQGGTGTITIEDDDTTLPTIELALSSQSVQEGTGTNVDPQIMVNVSPASGRTVTVQYALTEGTATEPEDFGLALGDTGTLSISAGQTTKAIPILIEPDAYDEDNEDFTVTISSPTYATLGTTTTNEVTIVDNDIPEASISTAYSAPEASGANDASGLKVSLSAASTKTVKVKYVFADGTAEQGVDYNATNGILTFSPDETTGLTPTSKFVPFSIIQDSINEAGETFTITLSIPDGGNATVDDAKKVATVTIGDDDTTLPIISIADAEGSEGDPDTPANDGKVTFTISLKNSVGTPVVAGRKIDINVTTSSPTTGRAIATAGTDYTTLTNHKVSIPKGHLGTTFDVITKQDIAKESDEIFEVTLTSANYADISTTANKATGTILSDDTPVFEIVDIRQVEGNTSTNNNMEFKVRLSSGVTGEATVDYATSDGPALSGGAVAKAGSDYSETTSIGGTPLRFRAGQKERIIRVPIVGDTKPEHNDTFTLTLSSPSTGTELLVGGESATGTIENDDGLVLSTISVAPATDNARVAEGEPVKFTFSAEPVLLNPLEVKISLTDRGNFLDTGVAATDKVNLDAGATDTKSFTTRTANTIIDPDDIVTLTIEADATKYKVGSGSTAQVVIEDDFTTNLTGISIIALEKSVIEGPENPTADFQVKSNVVDSSSRVINLNIIQGDANFLTTETLNNNRQITIDANERTKNLSLEVHDDGVFEINGDIEVQIADSDGTSATYNVANSNNSATIAVFDNDFPSTDADNSVSIRAVKSSVSETEVAPFQVIAKTSMTSSRTIKVLVANKNSGNFLPAATYDNPVDVVIGRNSLFANFDVTLDNDSKFEATGAITATIQAEDLTGGGTATYTVSSTNSAEIEVTSEDLECSNYFNYL